VSARFLERTLTAAATKTHRVRLEANSFHRTLNKGSVTCEQKGSSPPQGSDFFASVSLSLDKEMKPARGAGTPRFYLRLYRSDKRNRALASAHPAILFWQRLKRVCRKGLVPTLRLILARTDENRPKKTRPPEPAALMSSNSFFGCLDFHPCSLGAPPRDKSKKAGFPIKPGMTESRFQLMTLP